jgi:hypothetical protein
MGVLERLRLSTVEPTTIEPTTPNIDWKTRLRFHYSEDNPPVIELTCPNDGKIYPHISGEPKIETIKRYAIILLDPYTIGQLRQNSSKGINGSICFTISYEINKESEIPWARESCSGCPLSLETLQKGKVELGPQKAEMTIKSAGFRQDPGHCDKTWSNYKQSPLDTHPQLV